MIGIDVAGTWNDKYLDYEIETALKHGHKQCLLSTWNDKYLDYEIETLYPDKPIVWIYTLETTSTSITRLKLNYNRMALGKGFAWNDKYLDYEIETCDMGDGEGIFELDLKRQVPRLRDWNFRQLERINERSILETTSTSITRLKLIYT